MSTKIETIEGTYHYHPLGGAFNPEHRNAEIHVTRFYNGYSRGVNIQLTIQQKEENGSISYIHLTKEQCEQLAKALNESFDYKKYSAE